MTKGSAASRNAPKVQDGMRGGRTSSSRRTRRRATTTRSRTVEAGLVLTGTEVKSLRQGRCSLVDAYAVVQDGEAYLHGRHIPSTPRGRGTTTPPAQPQAAPAPQGDRQPRRPHPRERAWRSCPLSLYFKDGRAKVEIAVGRGRKAHDKRQAMAERDAQKEMRNAMGRALKRGRR
jgi:SsrA-binding protein